MINDNAIRTAFARYISNSFSPFKNSFTISAIIKYGKILKITFPIARAMLKDAPIVILDEATAYTDPENEAILQNSIAKLVAGKTLIVIAHRLSTVKDSDQIFVVNDGNVTAHGTHEQLLVSCPLYKEMWNAHISVKDTVREGE